MMFLSAPVRVTANDKGRATGLEYLRMELGEPDASGRRRPVPVPSSDSCCRPGWSLGHRSSAGRLLRRTGGDHRSAD